MSLEAQTDSAIQGVSKLAWSVAELANRLGVSTTFLRQETALGNIRATRLYGPKR